VLESIYCKSECFYSARAAKEIAKWMLRANHSIYAFLRTVVATSNATGEAIAEALKSLSERGINITVIGEGIEAYFVLNWTVAKKICPFINTSILFVSTLECYRC